MNKIECDIKQMQSLMKQMGDIYDAVRLVNASECCVMSLNDDGSIKYGNICYEIWNRSSRCRNCSSYRAHITGTRQEKKELFSDKLYNILSVPVTLLLNDGTPYSCIMELITIAGQKSDANENELSEAVASCEEEKDVLTGLYNAESFYRKTREILKKSPLKHYLVFADIDDFKFVNDLFGRVRGNEILLKTSAYLKELCASSGCAARLGADSFYLCLDEGSYSEKALLAIAKRVTELIGHSSFVLNIRFGVYTIEDTSAPVSTMCDRAKFALSTIKGDSEKKIAFYTNKMFEQKMHEQQIVSECLPALKNNEFVIFLQPQINSRTGLAGAECLVRWQHHREGLLAPGAFIEVLEKTGLIAKLDCYIWEEAAKLLKKWEGTPKGKLHLSVNISGKDFYYLDVFETLKEIVERVGINPKQLRLEITETVLISDIAKLIDITKKLRAYGFAIEIDDFGKGYSSLSMLKDIDVDILKIDMGFLLETEHNDKSLVILGSVINMSKALGLDVITEGVETEKQVSQLTAFGCNTFQGYYFARPMSVADFEKKYFPAG